MSCRTCGAVYGNVMHHEKDIICYHEYDDGWNLMARPIPERFPARAFEDKVKKEHADEIVLEYFAQCLDKYIGQPCTPEVLKQMKDEMKRAADTFKQYNPADNVVTNVTTNSDGTMKVDVTISGLACHPKNQYEDIAKVKQETGWPPGSDSIEDLQAMSQRNCAVGCRFFGTNLVHFICEVETIHDIVLRQDGKFEEIRRIASGMVVGPIKPLG